MLLLALDTQKTVVVPAFGPTTSVSDAYSSSSKSCALFPTWTRTESFLGTLNMRCVSAQIDRGRVRLDAPAPQQTLHSALCWGAKLDASFCRSNQTLLCVVSEILSLTNLFCEQNERRKATTSTSALQEKGS